jgi:elongation factor 1-beta
LRRFILILPYFTVPIHVHSRRLELLTCINSNSPSQADVAVYKALKSAPDADKYPHAARWYKHIASFEDEFATLPGDASKPYTAYGPGEAVVTINTAAPAPAAEEGGDDDDVDLFGSDDEEEDAEAAAVREQRLAAYREKKAAKPKVTAKSVVTLEVKPWGESFRITYHCI